MAGSSSSDFLDQQDTEVATIQAAFPNRCRVISDSGKFRYVVTVQPENLDATIKFKLSGTYPSVIPNISIRSESISEGNIAELERNLSCKAENLLGDKMILTLAKEAEQGLYNLGLRPGKTSVVENHTILGKKRIKEKKKKRKHKSEDEVVENEKLPSMKTSDDVVKRIIWDENLDKDDFVVGYIDRFRGLVEKYFSAFSWEDLSTVDYDVLAIPKHRIQYFSYKGVKVWDKPRRLDNVFGSASGTKTIDIVIKEIQDAEKQEQGEIQKENEDSSEVDHSTESSDEEDNIVVHIGASCGIGLKSNVNRPDNTEQQEYDPYWKDKLRPNYFICVRITNQEIRDQVGVIHDHLMQQEPLFGECCIPEAALHLTLCCVGLDTPEQLNQCVDAFKNSKPELLSALPKSVLKLRGTSTFYNRVIYAKVEYESDFLEFHSVLKQLLGQAGVNIRDGYDFVPHVTIMKTTRPVSRLRGTKDIDPNLYKQFSNTEFGEQEIDAIYLCSMDSSRRPDGFYLTPAVIHFEKS